MLYTINIVIVQITYYSGGNIDVTAEQAATLPQSDIDTLRYGSQLEFVSWYTYPGTICRTIFPEVSDGTDFIGTLKFMVLFFYRRLTLGILRTKTIKFLFWFCGASWIALILTVSLSCRPFSDNWRIDPLPDIQCTFRPQNFWVLVVLNVITDLALMSIPIPILWHLRVSKRRKLAVSILLLSGLFVVSTAVVRAVMTITGAPSVININRWGFREICVGLCAVSAPILCPLTTRGFWRKGAYQRRDLRDRWRPHGVRPAAAGHERPGFGTWIGTFELNKLEEDEEDLFRDSSSSSTLENGRFQGGTWSEGTASITMRDVGGLTDGSQSGKGSMLD